MTKIFMGEIILTTKVEKSVFKMIQNLRLINGEQL